MATQPTRSVVCTATAVAAPKKVNPSPLSQAAPSTYAIIEVGGTQLFVEPGKWYNVNRLSADVGAKIKFGRVLAFKKDEKLHVGTPYLENVNVSILWEEQCDSSRGGLCLRGIVSSQGTTSRGGDRPVLNRQHQPLASRMLDANEPQDAMSTLAHPWGALPLHCTLPGCHQPCPHKSFHAASLKALPPPPISDRLRPRFWRSFVAQRLLSTR